MRTSTPAENESTLAFLVEVREASLAELEVLRVNLSFGGPDWQRVAVDRAIRRARDVASPTP